MGYDFYQHYNVPVRTEVEFYDVELQTPVIHWIHGILRWGMWSGRHTEQAQCEYPDGEHVYDFRNSSAFTPWVSVGLGYAEYIIRRHILIPPGMNLAR